MYRRGDLLPCALPGRPSVARRRAQPMLVRRGHVLYFERLSDHLDSGRGIRGHRTRGPGLFLSLARPAPVASLWHRAGAGRGGVVCAGQRSGGELSRSGENLAATADLYAQLVDGGDGDLAAGTEPLLVAMRGGALLPVVVAGVSPMGHGALAAHRAGRDCGRAGV